MSTDKPFDTQTGLNQSILWLIDDDPALRLILEDNFSNAGMQVVSFANAHGAWTQLNELLAQQSNHAIGDESNKNGNDGHDHDGVQPPDVILTDIRMPLMDGLSFSDWLHQAFPDIPVIIMTAHSDLQSAIDSYQTGAFEYLPKPFDLDDAIAVVRKAIVDKAMVDKAMQRHSSSHPNPPAYHSHHQAHDTTNEADQPIEPIITANQVKVTTTTQNTQDASSKTTKGNTQPIYSQSTHNSTHEQWSNSGQISSNRLTSNNNRFAQPTDSQLTNPTSNKASNKASNKKPPLRKNQPSTPPSNRAKQLAKPPNGIIGQSPAMQTVFRAIGRLAHSPITVLITGESGTGKELIANALHQTSARHDQPFIALNMSAIPHDLIESELFGHEKGAFTGATSSRQGRFEQADGGTLFLDEIGDMPYNTQTRLLRVLANGEFFRVGGKDPINVDVRIISATHQNLEKLVKQGKFREDLFYRLNVIRLPLPSLRQRREDIPALVSHFLQKSATELDSSEKNIDPTAMQIMQGYHWHGNVRQLENACRWLTVMATGDTVYIDDLPPELLTAMEQEQADFIEYQPFDNGNAAMLPVPQAQVEGQQSAEGSQRTHLTEGSQDMPIISSSANQANQYAVITPTSNNGGIYSRGDMRNRGDGESESHRFDNNQRQSWQQSWQQGLELWTKQQLKQGESELLGIAIPDLERVMINTTLLHCKGNKGKAANLLGWGRNTLTRKIQQLGLDDRW